MWWKEMQTMKESNLSVIQEEKDDDGKGSFEADSFKSDDDMSNDEDKEEP